MQDRHFELHLTSILAAVTGCIGIALVVANFWFEGDNVGIAGIPFIAVATVLRIRSWFVRLSERERATYEVHRDSVRSLR